VPPSPRLRGEGLGVRGKRVNHPKRFHISNVHWAGVARRQVTFSCLAKRKFTKEKASEGGAIFFRPFLLGKLKKRASCRAAPGQQSFEMRKRLG